MAHSFATGQVLERGGGRTNASPPSGDAENDKAGAIEIAGGVPGTAAAKLGLRSAAAEKVPEVNYVGVAIRGPRQWEWHQRRSKKRDLTHERVR